MLKWLTCLLTIAFAQANEAPFWKAKPKVYERIENREVIVVVREHQGGKGSEKTLEVSGGGQVQAPRDFLYANAQKYADLPKITDYIQSAKFDAARHLLEVSLKAFSLHATMQIEVTAVHASEPWRLDYQVVSGPLSGFKGRFTFAELAPLKAEVGMEGEYKYEKFPLPQFFLRFGLEVVFQKIAQRLRGYVEEQWRSNGS